MKYIPYIVESTYGLDRIFLAVLFEAVEDEKIGEEDSRIVLKIKPLLAPIKINVLPLVKKRHSEKAKEIYNMLRKHFMVSYDEAGSIGKRYRRGDAIGTPFAITIDDNTLEKDIVTLRDRDTMGQIDIDINELTSYINNQLTLK